MLRTLSHSGAGSTAAERHSRSGEKINIERRKTLACSAASDWVVGPAAAAVSGVRKAARHEAASPLSREQEQRILYCGRTQAEVAWLTDRPRESGFLLSSGVAARSLD